MKLIVLAAILAATQAEAAIYTFDYSSGPMTKVASEGSGEERAAEALALMPDEYSGLTYRIVIDETKTPLKSVAGQQFSYFCDWDHICDGTPGVLGASGTKWGSLLFDRISILVNDDLSIAAHHVEIFGDPGFAITYYDPAGLLDDIEYGSYEAVSYDTYFNGYYSDWLTAYAGTGVGTWTVTISDPAPVPLPAALPILGAAIAGLGLLRRRHAAI